MNDTSVSISYNTDLPVKPPNFGLKRHFFYFSLFLGPFSVTIVTSILNQNTSIIQLIKQLKYFLYRMNDCANARMMVQLAS